MSSSEPLVVYRLDGLTKRAFTESNQVEHRILLSVMQIKRRKITHTTSTVTDFLLHHDLVVPVYDNSVFGIQKYKYRSDLTSDEQNMITRECTLKHFIWMTLGDGDTNWTIETQFNRSTTITDDIQKVCIVMIDPKTSLADFRNGDEQDIIRIILQKHPTTKNLELNRFYHLAQQQERLPESWKTWDLRNRKFDSPEFSPVQLKKPRTEERIPEFRQQPRDKAIVVPEGYSLSDSDTSDPLYTLDEFENFKVNCGNYEGYREEQDEYKCGMHSINMLMARCNPTNESLDDINGFGDTLFFDHIRHVIKKLQEYRNKKKQYGFEKWDYCENLDYVIVQQVLAFYGFIFVHVEGLDWINELVYHKRFSRTIPVAFPGKPYQDVTVKVPIHDPNSTEFLGVIIRQGGSYSDEALMGGHYIFICYKNGCWYNLDSIKYKHDKQAASPLTDVGLKQLLGSCTYADTVHPRILALRAPENTSNLFPPIDTYQFQDRISKFKTAIIERREEELYTRIS